MKLIDISLAISNETLAHPSENFFKVEPNRQLPKDGVATSKTTLGSHSGTHIDAPAHFLENAKGVDKIDLEKLIGSCQVIAVSPKNQLIKRSDIEGKINSTRVLF